MGVPTRDDVWLCLHLYEQRREPVLREARAWLSGFTPESYADIEAVTSGKAGDDANRYWRQAMSYWEMVAALMNSGGISPEARDLFAQTTKEWFFFWSKVAPFMEEYRAKTRPTAFQNLEAWCRSLPDHDQVMEFFARTNEQIKKRMRARAGKNGAATKPRRKAVKRGARAR